MHRRKNESGKPFRVRLGRETHDLIREAASNEGCDEGAAIRSAIERGMSRYWDESFKVLAGDLERQRLRLEDFQRDNRLLTALLQQNRDLEASLSAAGDGPR